MFKRGLFIITGSLLVGACAPQQSQMPSLEVRNLTYQANIQSEHLAKITERVRRVERAMIRLDGRMKLLERNELARFSSNQNLQMQPNSMNQQQARLQPTSFNTTNDIVNFARINSPFSKRIQPNYSMAPVNARTITSSLQVAPKPALNTQSQMASVGNPMMALPSLADSKAVGQEKDVSIWTIEYSADKIWPTRDQLANSQDVVSLLKGKDPVAIFARGANPSSKEFRERVRALSRYLGKVANTQDVAIATMPANHLDTDTIEVLVTK